MTDQQNSSKVNLLSKLCEEWQQRSAFMSAIGQTYEKIPNKNSKDWALLNCLDRLYLYVGSLTKLDQSEDFQAVASISRTIFELYIDLLLILDDKIENGTEKFLYYQDCRYMYDLECLKKHRGPEVFEREHESLAERLEQYESMDLRQKTQDLWGRINCPEHWSGTRSIWERIKLLEDCFYEKNFRLTILLYGYGSRAIHSGSMNLSVIGCTGQDQAIIECRWSLIYDVLRESKHHVEHYFFKRANGIV